MCGFGGVINNNKSLDAAEVGRIAGHVRFRGPDSCGVRIMNEQMQAAQLGNTALFFNRLAVIDLDKRSDQPFEDDEHLLIFNGEIYNYAQIKQELEQTGIRFRTTSDTEVLFFLLKIYGKSGIARVNGMFAFFWLDKKDKKFLIFRDRLGIKPLYYHVNGGSFYFGSELHSIIRLSARQPEIAPESVEMYLWMQFVPTPFSIFKNIFKLPPGSYIELRIEDINTNVTPRSYWDAYDHGSNVAKESELENVLRDSIGRQMQADVPIGLFLSSGVDSSLLAALVNKHFGKNQPVNFFTVSFNEKTNVDESEDAVCFIKGFKNPNLKNHLLEIDASSIGDRLNTLYNFYDEPFGDPAALLNWGISEKAREHVTVALSGDGADELFWGYDRYNKWQDMQKINAFPALSRAITMASFMLPKQTRTKARRAFQTDPAKRHFDLFFMPGFRSAIRKPITDYPLWALKDVNKIAHRKDATAMLDIKTYLADGMLYKVDRSSMATSLEVRVPYLDDVVLDYALGLPFNAKSNKNYRNKAILKELLTRLAPHYVNRPKRGFSFPLKSWLRERWKDQVLDTIRVGPLADMGLDPEPFMELVNNFYKRNSNQQVEIWYLFNLILWKESMNKMSFSRT